MPPSNERLIVFTRYPEPGRTKTRLIPALGPEGAALLQGQMADHTLRWARALRAACGTSIEVLHDGGDEERMQARFGSDLIYRSQATGDLGQRLTRAFADAFEAGARRVVIVGIDCPEIDARLARSAFERLTDHDLVLGPAGDGGYYLIGLGRPRAELFEGISWGTDRVLDQTLGAARSLELSTKRLEPLDDVDRPEDLPVWLRAKRRAGQKNQPELSIIIPTLNEARYLPETLKRIPSTTNAEVLVVDANSQDDTVRIAGEHGATVLTRVTPRARQMNAGATVATGRILLFLHADTRLPDRFDMHIRLTLAERGVVAGAFRLAIEGATGPLRLIQRVANLRATRLGMPYGDQTLFTTAETFFDLGGFPDLPIMEDFELVRRLRRRGRIAVVPEPVVTSRRRWQALGPWRTTRINQQIILGYHLGISPERLARWYQSGRDR